MVLALAVEKAHSNLLTGCRRRPLFHSTKLFERWASLQTMHDYASLSRSIVDTQPTFCSSFGWPAFISVWTGQ